MSTAIIPAEVESWRGWIGRSEDRTQLLEVESLRRFAAAVGEDLDVERRQPSLAHWAFFLPTVPNSEIGEDGHPHRGGFLPPITLPRRMFAACEMRFARPLRLGQAATRTSTIANVTHKSGRTGDLVLVDVDHVIAQAGETCVAERQTIVFRDEGGPTQAVQPAALAPAPGDAVWQPGPVELFRFSAVTFNGHRIHYDAPYATGVEGYPGLVVHGPYTATRLYGHAAARGGGRPTRFAFRAVAPLFVGQPILLTGGETPGACRAIRCDGTVAMAGTIAF